MVYRQGRFSALSKIRVTPPQGWGEHYGVRLMIAVPLLFQEGICKLLESEKDIEIVAKASTPLEIIPVVKQNKPDVLFIDTAIPELDIAKILKLIEKKSPETKVLLLLLDEEAVINAMSLGAWGYLTVASNAKRLIKAIKAVSKDEIWTERKIIAKVLTRPPSRIR